MPEKNEEIEQPIPLKWRPALERIVDDIRGRNLGPDEAEGFTISVESGDADHIYKSIDSYGDELIEIPEAAWQTSICRWMGDHWNLLIDLFTVEEGTSDLVLFVDLYEQGETKRFEVQSVHVP